MSFSVFSWTFLIFLIYLDRNKIVDAARSYIGVPYVTCGFSPILGFGCWGFFMRVCHDLGLHAPKISNKILKARHEVLIRAVYGAIRRIGFIETKTLEFGNVAVRIEGQLKGHIGILTHNKIIHVTKKGVQETDIVGNWQEFQLRGLI